MSEELGRLRKELEGAREANRRLNRRAQAAEQRASRLLAPAAGMAADLGGLAKLFRWRYHQLRALVFAERGREWELWAGPYYTLLPRPNGFVDGPEQRCVAARDRIRELEVTVDELRKLLEDREKDAAREELLDALLPFARANDSLCDTGSYTLDIRDLDRAAETYRKYRGSDGQEEAADAGGVVQGRDPGGEEGG